WPALLALCDALLVAEVFTRRFLSGPGLRRRARPVPAAVQSVTATAASEGVPVAAKPSAPVAEAPKEEPKPAAPGVKDALAAARERARKRTGK
ncbi:MAG: hypothetical protein ACO1OB_10275, partial [Archangium sp.]